MRPRGFLPSRSQEGFTLIETMIAMVIVVISALAFSEFMSFYKARVEMMSVRRVQANHVLVTTANTLKSMDFDELHLFCEAKNAIAANRSGGCTSLSRNPGPSDLLYGIDNETQKPKLIEYRIGWDGKASESGEICVELLRCEPRSDGNGLSLNLRARWLYLDSVRSSPTLTVARGRW